MIDRVYLLWQYHPYEDRELHGVFRTKENAESFASYLLENKKFNGYPDDLSVEEEPFTDTFDD